MTSPSRRSGAGSAAMAAVRSATTSSWSLILPRSSLMSGASCPSSAARGIEDQRFAPLLDVQRTDVRQRRFLRVAHVLQQRSRGGDRERQLVGTEALQVERAELVGEEARGARELEVPGRSRAQRGPGAREGLIAGAFGEQQLRGLQPLELRGERLSPFALEHREAAGGEIEPGEPEAPS